MRKRSWMAVLIAAGLCLAFAAPVAAKDPVRPFGGSFTTHDTYDLTRPGCPSDAFLKADIVGQGQFQHLGLTKIHMTHCTWPDLATGAGWTDVGEMTLTAASGDTLLLHYQAAFQMDPWPDFVTSTVDSTPWTGGRRIRSLRARHGLGRRDQLRGHGRGHGDLLAVRDDLVLIVGTAGSPAGGAPRSSGRLPSLSASRSSSLRPRTGLVGAVPLVCLTHAVT